MKRSMKRYLAMLLAMTLVLQQGGTITLADEKEPASETVVEKTTEAKPSEKKAEENKPEEKKPEETKEPESKAPETKPEAPKTEENKTAETKSEETNAPDAQTGTQTDDTTTEAGTGDAEKNTDATEPTTQAGTESEAVTEGTTEGETQTASGQEKESEKDSESETEKKEEAQLEVSVMQEVFQKTVDDATVPMVKYTVKIANKTETADAEGATLKVLLADALSYKKEEGETPELISFENLGKAIEATAFAGEELNEEQKTAYANGNVVLWKDQTVAAGAEKTFVFCAEVKDGQMDVDALKNLWLVNGEAVADEKIQWVNTELLEVEEEHQAEYVFEDDNKTVTAILSNPEALPVGAELVVEDLTPEEYEANKAIIADQMMSEMDADIPKADKELLVEQALKSLVLFDIHFVYNGEEIEPDGSEVSVSIVNKKAVSMEKSEIVEGKENLYVPDEKAEDSIKVVHIKEDGGDVQVEDVTDNVETNAKGAVKTVDFTTDSFSVMGYYEETVDQYKIPLIDDTFLSEGGSYSLYYILNNYNVFVKDNATAGHTVGAVAVGGLGTFANGIGLSDYFHSVKSYFGKEESLNSISDYEGGRNIVVEKFYRVSAEWKLKKWKLEIQNAASTWIDFKTAFDSIYNEITGYAQSADNIIVDPNVASDYYSIDGNTIHLEPGHSYKFLTFDGISKIDIKADATSGNIVGDVNIICESAGTVELPPVFFNEKNSLTGNFGHQVGDGLGVAFMLPGATLVRDADSTQPHIGNVIAPKAKMENVNGDANGCWVVKELNIPGTESHMWPYNGELIKPAKKGFSATKTVDLDTPTTAQKFDFILEEYKDNAWVSLQKVKNDKGSIAFDEITYESADTHWYMISEDQTPQAGYTLSNAKYVIKVVVKKDESADPASYIVDSVEYYKLKDNVNKDQLTEDGSVHTELLTAISGPTEVTFDNKELTRKEVEKVWVGDKEDERPESIQVQLLADGEASGNAVTLNAANNWSYTWENLPKKANGEEIVYTVKEIDAVTGYTTAYATDAATGKVTITNTYTQKKGSLTVKKTFAGDLTAEKLEDEQKKAITFTVTGPDGYKNEFTYADMTDGSKKLENLAPGEYVVKETNGNVDGYTVETKYSVTDGKATVTAETETTVEVTNTYTQKKGALKIKKNVTVNGAATTGTEADGVYKFEVKDAEGKKVGDTVELTVKNGASVEERVNDLVPGTYTVSELTGDLKDGMSLIGENDVEVEVTADTTTEVQTAEFTNNLVVVKVSIEKVDENGKALIGAKLIIKDAAGNVVGEPWTTNGKPHEITGLKKGTYTLSELEAPEGYQVSKDVPFEITGTEENNTVIPVKMTDKKVVESKRSLRVTKQLRLEGLSTEGNIVARAATYYVALFEDEARTQRVTDVKKIVFENESASSVTFENLEEKIYYIGETDENGTLIPGGKLSPTMIYYPIYDDEAMFKFEGRTTEGIAEFTNVYVEWPDYFYLSGQLTVTKQVLLGGEECDSDDTFYARIFNDAGLTDPVSDEVLVLDMAGGSRTSVTVTNLPIGDKPGSSRKYYVAETDEYGNPLDPDEVTEYTISVDKSEITLDASNATPEVVITNDFHEEESEFESEVDEEKTAPKTGEDTDYAKYLFLLTLSAGTCAVLFAEKRRKAKRVRK